MTYIVLKDFTWPPGPPHHAGETIMTTPEAAAPLLAAGLLAPAS
ncbi:hypothetical protein [Hymenobacter ruber]